MSIFSIPRCQHLKVNGTQCGSPALKRNRFCFFHKRFQEERIKLNCDRARNNRASFTLPVLEDANSIQVSLMQIMRLLASRQIDSKIAGLLLYALQTATFNLRHLTIEPTHIEDVVIDRRTIDQTHIGCDQWSEEDFPDPEETEEEKAAAAAEEAAEAATAARAAARAKARHNAQLEAEADRLIRHGDPTYVDEPPNPNQPPDPIIPPIGQPLHSRRPRAAAHAPSAAANHSPARDQSAGHHPSNSAKLNQKKEPKKVDMDQVRKKIQGMARDWIMETAKQSSQPGSEGGKPVAKNGRPDVGS
jgi:hypothetical protein